jgi:spermidine synthase
MPPWPKDILTKGAGFFAGVYVTPEALLTAARESELLFYKDGIATTLSVDRQNGVLYYRSNGKTDASTDPGDMANQLLLGHLPMLLHPSPRDVFVLGLGTGVTAAAVARYPVETIDIADIEASVREAAQLFGAENRNILEDRRARLIVADGRNALLARKKNYDVIISDPSDTWVAGVGNLFTSEFYSLVRSRLRPGGVMVQWFHMHMLPAQQLQLIVATFRSVFPNASLWRPNRGDVILVGTVDPVPWDRQRLTERYSVGGVSEDLRRIGFWHPLAIFSAFVLDGEDLARMLANVQGVHTDDRPVLEYLSPRAGYEDTTSINDAGLQALQTKFLPAITGFEEARDFDARARYLLGFGMASIGRVDPAITLMEQSVRGDPQDPKFFTGLANQYRAKGWTAKAIDAYAKALARAPSDSEAAQRLAELRRAQGNDAEAEKALRTALAHVPGDPDLATAAARLLIETGRPAEAIPLLDRARQAAPSAEIDLLAGQALAESGRREEAVAALRRSAEAAREDARIQRAAAEALLKLEDLEGAATAYARAAELQPASADAFAGLARIAARRGDAAGFRSARQRALELDPYNPGVLALPRN